MASNTPEENYPFATKDGDVIPLDIIKSKGIIKIGFTAGAEVSAILPTEAEVGVLFASEACFVLVNDGVSPTPILSPLVNGTFYPRVLYIPKNHAITCALKKGEVKILGASAAGILIIEVIERWAGLALDVSYNRR